VIVGTGVDIAEISRFQRFVEEGNEPLLRRLFTEGERSYCQPKRNGAQHYALRFAAKEAFVKALGTGLRDGITWLDMEVVNDLQGKPSLRLAGRAAEICSQRGVTACHLALSHDAGMALAMVVLEGP
jgi:holo-[acyl-carrier protein] synthase